MEPSDMHLYLVLILFWTDACVASTDACAGRNPVFNETLKKCSAPDHVKNYIAFGCVSQSQGASCYIKFEDETKCETKLTSMSTDGQFECEFIWKTQLLVVSRKTSADPDSYRSNGTTGPAPGDHCKDSSISPNNRDVEYGKPFEATCSMPHKPPKYELAWELSLPGPDPTTNTSVTWKIDHLTELEIKPSCYMRTSTVPECAIALNLTVYKPPDRVELNSKNRDAFKDGEKVEMICEIYAVAPLKNLVVQWIRLHQKSKQVHHETSYEDLHIEGKGINVTVTANFSIQASSEQDGAQYLCSSMLKLNTTVVNDSEPLTINVHYAPYLTSSDRDPEYAVKGQSLTLSCDVRGNPQPRYNWTLPDNTTLSNSTTIVFDSIQEKNQGLYTCTAYNDIGSTTMRVEVVVVVNYLPIIAGCVVAAIALLSAILITVCYKYYKNTHMGHYILKNISFQRHSSHVAHNNAESNQVSSS